MLGLWSTQIHISAEADLSCRFHHCLPPFNDAPAHGGCEGVRRSGMRMTWKGLLVNVTYIRVYPNSGDICRRSVPHRFRRRRLEIPLRPCQTQGSWICSSCQWQSMLRVESAHPKKTLIRSQDMSLSVIRSRASMVKVVRNPRYRTTITGRNLQNALV